MSNFPKIRRRTQSGAAAEIQVLSAGAMGEIVRDLGDAYGAPPKSRSVPNLAGLRLSATAFALVNLFDVVITTQSRVRAWRRKQARS